jgi:hypothetical protein
VWDPRTGQFSTVSEATAPTPRAFHGAQVINDAPPWQILLVGGVTADPSSFALGNHLKPVDGARLVPYAPTGTVPTPFPTMPAAAEILTYDPSTVSATRAPASGFPTVAFPASLPLHDGLAVAGGVGYGAANTTDISRAKELTVGFNGNTPHTGTLSSERVGATLSPLYGDDALAWGGQYTNTGTLGDHIALLSSAAPNVSPATLVGTQPPPVQFHTATTFSSSTTMASVLVTGGFQVMSDRSALQPPNATASTYVLNASGGGLTMTAVTPDSTYVFDAGCTMMNRFRPTGYASAILLPSTDVLLTGGAPSFSAACNDCESSPGTLLCSTHQASRFVAPSTLTKIDQMQIGRFGHSSTLLRDGTILIVGGIDLPSSGNARTVGDAEVYNPRALTPPAGDPDDPLAKELTRDPGVASHPCPLL